MNKRAGDGKAYLPTECEHIANICTHGVCVHACACQVMSIVINIVYYGYL